MEGTTGHAASPSVAAKVLVVDDDPRNLLAVRKMLQAPAVEVVTAESGKAALRHVLSEEFAAILLDVQMPGMDGYEVARLIRARPQSARVPILFLTAFNQDDLQVFRGYNAGAVDYVFKPIEPLILQSKVHVFVDLYRKTEEIRRQATEERRLLMENLRVRNEKLQTEQMLRRREEHQSIVLKSLSIALFTAPLQQDHRRLQFSNASIAALTGFTPEAFLEQEDFWSTRLHPEDRDQVFARLGQVVEAGTVSLEYRWRCADDSYRCVLDHAVLVRDENGGPHEIFGMWFDITERKQLEQNLLHASKLEAVGRMTGGIAHDFNNMLSVVVGNLDLLRKTVAGNDKAERRVRMAMESAQHCAALTHRLLAFSRRQPLQAATLELGALMPGFVELMRRTLGENIRIQLQSPETVWLAQADQAQLAALLNLAVNARDAMPDGGDLTIALDNRTIEDPTKGSDYVMVAVSDTGVGMPADVRERVFEPFFTIKVAGRGTGLGLSMVYGFVQQSGGHVEIDSTEGEGTTVRLWLPRAEADAMPLTSDPDAEHVVPVGEGAAALVVEDDPNVRQVAVSTLHSLGFTVTEAGTADEAAEILKANGDFRLVLSDVRMPGRLNGIDLAGLIKQEHPAFRSC